MRFICISCRCRCRVARNTSSQNIPRHLLRGDNTQTGIVVEDVIGEVVGTVEQRVRRESAEFSKRDCGVRRDAEDLWDAAGKS